MRYMYTHKKEDRTHEFEGVYRRAVHRYEEKDLLAKDWKFHPSELPKPAIKEGIEQLLKKAEEYGIPTKHENGNQVAKKTLEKAIQEYEKNRDSE